jgi:VWFA-related protein
VPGQLVLDAVVVDKSGKPVSSLQPQDFTILDNGQPARILSLRPQGGAADLAHATEVVLVVDEVNCLFETLQHVRRDLKEFLAENGGELPYPVSLAFFTEKGLQIQTHPSRDGNALIAALEQHKLPPPRTGPSFGNGLVPGQQRLQESLEALTSLTVQERATPWKKMVIWISPGWPTEPDPRSPSLGSKDEQRVFNLAVSYSGGLRQARITLYSINPLGAPVGTRSSHYREFVKGLTSASGALIADLGLETIAAQTGGLAVFGNDTIGNLIHRCTPDLGAFYTLSIAAPQAGGATEFHSLDMKVGTPGLTVRTRTGYYVESPDLRSKLEAAPQP